MWLILVVWFISWPDLAESNQTWNIGGRRQPTPPIFGNLDAGHPYAFGCCHVQAHYWATWRPFIRPRHHSLHSYCHVILLRQLSMSPDMWLYSFPRGCTDYQVAPFHWSMEFPKKSKNEWHVAASSVAMPPCWHHADIRMTHVTLCVWHVHCTNVDVIHTDANVGSTYVDSSLLTGLGWSKIRTQISFDQ
jgi:hypothetical protein